MLSSSHLYAGHVFGGEIMYECLGGLNYEVTLVLYRDCPAAIFGSSQQIQISSINCQQNLFMQVDTIIGAVTELPITLSGMITDCNGGTLPNLERWEYRGTVSLPANCWDWVFTYSTCCRNDYANALNVSSFPGTGIFAWLNNIDGPCNNSPRFSEDPFHSICLGNSYTMDNSTTDVDGDTPEYELFPAFDENGNDLMYYSPYSFLSPLISSPIAQMGLSTGLFEFTPQELDQPVVVFIVNEFRNGTIVGSVMREIQLNVLPVAGPCTTDILEEKEKTLNFYPNPSSGLLYYDPGIAIDKVQLMDQLGRTTVLVVKNGQIDLPNDLENGSYKLVIGSNDQLYFKSIILLR